MERHQIIAISIFIAVISLINFRAQATDDVIDTSIGLFVVLLPILFYRLVAYLASFGFPEILARDYGSKNDPQAYAVFFWMLFIIACLFVLFDWQIY